MDGNSFGKAMADAILGLVILAFMAGGALIAILLWGVPWAWGLLKPLLHAWTA